MGAKFKKGKQNSVKKKTKKGSKRKVERRPSYVSTPIKSQRAAAIKSVKKYPTQKKKRPFLRYRAKNLFGPDVSPHSQPINVNNPASPRAEKTDGQQGGQLNAPDVVPSDGAVNSRESPDQPAEKLKKEKKKRRLFGRRSDKKNKKTEKRRKDSDEENKMTVSNARTRTHRDVEDWLKWRSYLNEHLAGHILSGEKLDMNDIPIKSVPETIETDALKAILKRAYRKDMPLTTLDQIAYVVYGVPRTHIKPFDEILDGESEAYLDFCEEDLPEPDYNTVSDINAIIRDRRDRRSNASEVSALSHVSKTHKQREEKDQKKQAARPSSRLGPFAFLRKHKHKPDVEYEAEKAVGDKEAQDEADGEDEEPPPGYAPSMAEIMRARANLSPVCGSTPPQYRAADVLPGNYISRQRTRTPSQNSACPSPVMYQGIPEGGSVSRQGSSVSALNVGGGRNFAPVVKRHIHQPSPLAREMSNRSSITNARETPLVHVPKHALLGFRYAQLSRQPSDTSSNLTHLPYSPDGTPNISRVPSSASAAFCRPQASCPMPPPLPPSGEFQPINVYKAPQRIPPTPPPKPYRPDLRHRALTREISNASSYYTIPEHPDVIPEHSGMYTGKPRILPSDLARAIHLTRKPSTISAHSSIPPVTHMHQ